MDARRHETSEPGSRTFSRLFWAGTVVVGLALVWLARFRPSWPWFSLWVLALLGLLAVLSIPRVRGGLNLSWFAVTLLVLTGTGLFDLYLFHVETHRQRSERLEVRGVYFGPDADPIRVGVGREGLDVRLEGSLYDFDRWSVELRALDATRFVVERPYQVDMLRLRSPGAWWPGRPTTEPALGAPLSGRRRSARVRGPGGEDVDIELLPRGRRGTLRWGTATAPLTIQDPLLDRRLSSRLNAGVPLAELDWDTVPDPALASDLVLTRTRRGRALGRLRLTLPRYRLVSRSYVDADPEVDSVGPVLSPGDTLWVTSRGKTWAFALDRVPDVSRVAAPVAVLFVRRPRPTGWALPSPEACGRSSDRCAVISTRPLPPPQPHFDLSGFGLDTARYSILARLETDGDGVRVVGARSSARVAYGALHPLPALDTGGRDDGSTGILMSVSREAQGRQSAVLLTVLTLYLVFIGALLVLSGDARLWERRKADSPHMTAAWGFLNVFVIFLGIRLALGLRVAYTPPFYDRAAATAVGLWVTFTVMLVALGRWSSWAPLFWRTVGRVERPISRLFLPGLNGSAPSTPSRGPGAAGPSGARTKAAGTADPGARRARFRTAAGLLLFLPGVGFVLWQRPEAAAGLLVAAVGLGAWLAMGVARAGVSAELSRAPLSVITADGGGENPSESFAVPAGVSVVLVLAMHAPELALAPVLLLRALFGVNLAVGWTAWADRPVRRGWVVYGTAAAMAAAGLLVFLPWRPEYLGGLAAAALGLGLWLARSPAQGIPSRMEALFGHFTDLGKALFSGVGWIGVLLVLGLLVFLNSQVIPPFVRFALVFMLFLLAIRAGLACHRVLLQGTDERGRQKGRIEALGLLVIPLGVLLVFMLFDFGLGLVFFAPMFVTVLLAARIDRLPVALMFGSAAVVAGVGLVALSVLRPSLADLRASPDVPTFSREYGQVGSDLVDVLRTAGLSGPITRATVRSMAASDPALLEEALAFAGPSEALLAAAPSREQVWGGRAYAASGWTGTGFAGTALLGRGVPTAVSYAENTYSVYVLS
ncbi:MAG TPA: hypothetical protein VJ997_01255, partial [Longimicrobiales bacterium]|nr:hypothetical protein [Longimicrobiales bacterium]